jgi:3'(2'), 5'-bisphosphate nucleotidase
VAQLSDAAFVASRSHRSAELDEALALLGGRETRTVGSAGLKGAEVASGGAEGYVAPGTVGKRWDACAIDALVRAAGGRFTDAHGRAFDYRSERLSNDDGIVATNGLIHDAVLARLTHLA